MKRLELVEEDETVPGDLRTARYYRKKMMNLLVLMERSAMSEWQKRVSLTGPGGGSEGYHEGPHVKVQWKGLPAERWWSDSGALARVVMLLRK